jgi:hypothetical protein
MMTKIVSLLVAMNLVVLAQTKPEDNHAKKTTGLYQRTPGSQPYQQKDDFFHASTKLVNPSDVNYGELLEQRRRAFLEASIANPFFWYSALTTTLLIVLMMAYGVRVMDEKRRLWHAAEILTDVWNDSELARDVARTAIEKHNRHMQECNRVIEAQLGGRSSPAAVEASDLREELMRLRSELDNVDGERKILKAQLEDKEKLVDNMSVRLNALEKSGFPNIPAGKGNGGAVRAESESRLVARINQLTQQLEAEKQKNRTLKGA